MANSISFRNKAVDAVALNGGANWWSLHTGDPGTTGANEVTGGDYVRIQASFPIAVSGASSTVGATSSVPSGTTVVYWGRWTSQTGGTFFTGGTLPNGGDTFGSAGTYTNVNTVAQAA